MTLSTLDYRRHPAIPFPHRIHWSTWDDTIVSTPYLPLPSVVNTTFGPSINMSKRIRGENEPWTIFRCYILLPCSLVPGLNCRSITRPPVWTSRETTDHRKPPIGALHERGWCRGASRTANLGGRRGRQRRRQAVRCVPQGAQSACISRPAPPCRLRCRVVSLEFPPYYRRASTREGSDQKR
jgi:hypothetical protein